MTFLGNLFFKRFPNIQKRTFVFSTNYLQRKNEEAIERIPQQIGFIGDGNMAKAICRGIVNKGLISYSQIHVSSPYIKNLNAWKEYGANISTDNSIIAANTDVVFLAVKPHVLSEVVDDLRKSENCSKIKNKLFVSILAGFTLEMLESLLSTFSGSRVIRVMPNTPMMIGEGCTAYCLGKNITMEDQMIVRRILEMSGICERVPENHINAVTALSGGGPSFVYLMIEALSDGGVRMGLHRDMAIKFAVQTVLGAAKMVQVTGKHPGALKDEVCSAGGSTIAGMHALERSAVRGAIMDAVEASARRAAELGKSK